jgi:DNA polymerase epsilon subunit 1
MSYVTQDIKCQKCNEVRAGFLQRYCECSGLYENLMSNEEASQLVRAMKDFAK